MPDLVDTPIEIYVPQHFPQSFPRQGTSLEMTQRREAHCRRWHTATFAATGQLGRGCHRFRFLKIGGYSAQDMTLVNKLTEIDRFRWSSATPHAGSGTRAQV